MNSNGFYLKASPTPPAPWLLARCVFAGRFCFYKCLFVCCLAGFWILFSGDFFKTALIFEPNAVSLGTWNCYLASLVPSFWDPGGPFWQLGGTLGGQGSSRRDTLGSGVGFLLIWDGFRDPIFRVSLAIWSKFSLLLCLFPGFGFSDSLVWFCSCGVWKTRISCERMYATIRNSITFQGYPGVMLDPE